ncbi:tRNA (adenosine(37)-N6)-threonylcarbamoyltransferase complex ATPase subunit type 1 TsaE [Joostella atrarenae]|uniref:tRNA threonylcarbamoyladenosine biosynthesis protein TsaE n=1 Tax=Joostella atrarenae TaxID=679257 RepID=A0ABS9J1C2_9FLAO|nr:tRNA (adenosine(37)-N6)-threonylcarbamoyltransferase complex ATPase subunit type 1 TsaE [Joostella atrarenae]MCF8714165.1 tRNA (adenosine(37)-N6)-threonylcarbamoyltransferase complex ATPase subunit type 1 TsaE [Joostella atrarenae]
MITRTYTLDELDKIAKEIVLHAKNKIILFKGEMGAGKTTLIKKIVEELGSQDHVSSPTFSLVNEYQGTNDTIYHFDLYRIEDVEEIHNIGFEDYIYSNAWCFIEWPDKIMDFLPKEVTVIDIKTHLNDERTLVIN